MHRPASTLGTSWVPGSSLVCSGIMPGGYQLQCFALFLLPCRDLGSELRNSLTCMLDGSKGSSKALDRCITLLVDGISRRLDLTQQLIDIMARRDHLNIHLNYSP